MRHRTLVARTGPAIVLACLVVIAAGCGGGSDSDAEASEPITTATTTTETTAAVGAVTESECQELATLVEDPAPTLTMTWEEAVLTRAADIEDGSAALTELASQAPEELRTDFETVAAAWAAIATLIADLGIETGASPGPAQVEATNQRVRDALAAQEFSAASESVAAWVEDAVTQCMASTETEPTETGVAIGEVDETATTKVNEAMSRVTERELGSPPVGSEVRDCRKERDLSEGSLIAPGGVSYVCEVWFEDDRQSDGLAAIDAEGNVAMHP